MSISGINTVEGEAMKSIRFSIPGQPMGKQRPRVVHNGSFSQAFTPKETVSYENLVRVMYREAAKGKRFADEDMLDVRVIAYYSIPKSTSKKKRKMMLEHKIRPGKKPDWDNIGKIICDSLNTVAYSDDSSIVDAQVRKFYSENPRVDVTIRRIDPGEI
nr:MAG: endodeoxyribonuclease [Bacteriophage sp.]